MPDKHLSTQFDADLDVISNNLMRLGGLVESQVSQAIYALSITFYAFPLDSSDRRLPEDSFDFQAYWKSILHPNKPNVALGT